MGAFMVNGASTPGHSREYIKAERPQQRAYSQAVITEGGKTVWLAGQMATVDDDGKSLANDLDGQVRQVFKLLNATLEKAGGKLADMVQMTVFITDVRYGDRLTQVRREIFGDNFPGSALITITALANPDAKVGDSGVRGDRREVVGGRESPFRTSSCGPALPASRRMATGRSMWGHPSRRLLRTAPQDEVHKDAFGSLPDVELHALGQRQRGAVIDGVGGAAHVGLPGIGAGLAAAAGFLLAAEGAADLGAGRADVDVGDAAVGAGRRDEALGLAQVVGEDRRGQALRHVVVQGDRLGEIA